MSFVEREVMTVDMNRSDTDILKRPVAANGLSPWLIIGCSLGGALLLTLLIATFVYVRRRRSARKGSDHLVSAHPTYVPGSEFCPQHMMSSFSSSLSDDSSETAGGTSGSRAFRRPLGPSTSLDPPSLLCLTSECVQPRAALTRCHTVASPQTTPVLLDAERDSDDDPLRRFPCLYGRIWFSLDYKPNLGHLEVTLVKAKYLPGRGLVNSPRDPFVKVYLLPDEETVHQSKIRKRTLSPKFHETFTFDVSPDDVLKRIVKLSVYDVDKRKVRHCLGHVLQPLETLEAIRGRVISKDLEMAPQEDSSLGDIQLCLSCNPFSNRIKVTICRVRNLQDVLKSEAAVFVRVELYHGRRLVKCKRTQSAGRSAAGEMVFDESFSFGVSGRFFDSCSLGFAVVSEAEDVVLGRVVVGPFMYARGDQLLHWQEMLSNPRNMVTRWHPLQNDGTHHPRRQKS